MKGSEAMNGDYRISVYLLKRLPVVHFGYENHENDYFDRLGMPSLLAGHLTSLEDRFRATLARHAIGYADGSDVPYEPTWGRSRDHDWAIMFEDERFEKFWCHVPKICAIVFDAETGLDAEAGYTFDEYFKDEDMSRFSVMFDPSEVTGSYR